MKDCTTCQHCQSCDTYFSCELHDDVWERADTWYTGHDCDDYEKTDYTMTQVWDWR